ncbi:DUF305 domain-containing protein [Arthrobacter crystallopoietes]|uniref:Uncharacterized conserved protein, DUF305 family n=1 Tax=Crystallibacter crystallopoietes TaxID=37928 RepID=A0A1H1ABU2_9MICC|nr:DUF305 domain-containing protein [Arthrobacter crystallopoietes]AUI51590.1 DUF305 domain-containing protein [Arthrobacter crystallopoietes]SDQ37153.1 Uncharacterized conserved protein, DUF305 family [Arthrobacter crystallopoietes]
MKRFTAISTTAVAAALFLAGCGSDTGSNTTGEFTGMDHSTMSHSPAPASSDAGGTHNSADAMFAQMMIPHHEQAVQMSDIMLAKEGLDPQITQLAEEIKAAQGPEIEKMTAWLQTWDEPMEMSGDHAMEGMLSPDDLAELEAAQGAEASRLFLTQMIEHHEGAIAMAEEEAANGQDPDAVALAETIVADQKAEIEKMNNLLAAL